MKNYISSKQSSVRNFLTQFLHLVIPQFETFSDNRENIHLISYSFSSSLLVIGPRTDEDILDNVFHCLVHLLHATNALDNGIDETDFYHIDSKTFLKPCFLVEENIRVNMLNI